MEHQRNTFGHLLIFFQRQAFYVKVSIYGVYLVAVGLVRGFQHVELEFQPNHGNDYRPRMATAKGWPLRSGNGAPAASREVSVLCTHVLPGALTGDVWLGGFHGGSPGFEQRLHGKAYGITKGDEF